jgi:glycosyltransferase involved in cell wall biosynthesis
MKMIFEYCNRLANRHSVFIVTLTEERPDWFPLNSSIQVITSSWNDKRLSYDLPDADIAFATHWATANYVVRLPASKGKKVYFVQDYESITIATPEQADPTYLLPMKKIVVSTRLGEQIKECSGDEPYVIPYGMELGEFYSVPSIREKYSSQDFRIGMLCHWEPRKGFAIGVEAFRIVQKKIPNAKLILFGTSKPADDVSYEELHLNISGGQVRDYYNSLDVYVSSSYQEGFGLPGLEAMACGVPIVTTDSGGVREYAVDGETAIVCPPGDAAALADAMARLHKDSILQDRLRKNGLQKAKEFTWERSITKMEKFLLEYSTELDAGFQKIAEKHEQAITKIGKFYSETARAPLRLRLLWKLRDKVQGWKLRYNYLLARRFK